MRVEGLEVSRCHSFFFPLSLSALAHSSLNSTASPSTCKTATWRAFKNIIRKGNKKPSLRKRGKINPLLSIEWHLGSLVLIHFFLSASAIRGLSLCDGWGVGLHSSLLGGQAPNVAKRIWRICVYYAHALSFAFFLLFWFWGGKNCNLWVYKIACFLLCIPMWWEIILVTSSVEAEIVNFLHAAVCVCFHGSYFWALDVCAHTLILMWRKI